MNTKALLAMVAAIGLASPALAQTTGATDPSEAPGGHDGWVSEEERLFYDEHQRLLGPFFFDETFTELRTEEDMRTAWAELPAEDQTAMRTNCEGIIANPTAYSRRTVDMCNQLDTF